MENYLSDAEKSAVERFVGDPIQFEAVRKVLCAGIYFNGVLVPGKEHDPSKNAALTQAFQASINNVPITDEELGHALRAKAEGLRFLETGFSELKKLKEAKGGKKESGKKNPAL